MRRFVLTYCGDGQSSSIDIDGVEFPNKAVALAFYPDDEWETARGFRNLEHMSYVISEFGRHTIKWIDAERECTPDQLRKLARLRETIAICNACGDWTPDQLHELAQRYKAIMAKGTSGETRPAVITTVEAMEQLRKLGLLTEEKKDAFERVWNDQLYGSLIRPIETFNGERTPYEIHKLEQRYKERYLTHEEGTS